MAHKLLEYMYSHASGMKACGSRRKKNFTDSDRACASMRLFLRDDVPLMRVIDPAFVADYGRFLFGGRYTQARKALNTPGKHSGVSPATMARHFKALRTIARAAMCDGLVPAIDVFPAVMAQLKGEFGLPDDLAADMSATGESRHTPTHGFESETGRLISTLPGDLSTRPRIKKALPALMYLMGIYSYGLEMAELLDIKCTYDTTDVFADKAVTIAHPRIGEVRLPERALLVADLLNKGTDADGYLIHRRPEWQGSNAAEIAVRIAADLAEMLRKERISLFGNRSIYADWLCMLKESGASDAQVQALSTCLQSVAQEIDKPAIVRRADAMLQSRSIFSKRWHILCSYSPRVDSTALRADVARYLKEKGVKFDRTRESYDPHSIEKRLVRGKVQKRNNPIISRYLFVYCTADTARLVDRMHPQASMLRAAGGKNAFATVNHTEVTAMVNFLRDFRDDVQLVGIDVPPERFTLAEGVKVRILTGPFAGFEGTIAQVLGMKAAAAATTATDSLADDEDHRLYQVEVPGFAMSEGARVTIHGLEIEATGS